MDGEKITYIESESIYNKGSVFERIRRYSKDYIAIARPDHWFKNVFMLPGTALALILGGIQINSAWPWMLVIGIIATCAIASANYTITSGSTRSSIGIIRRKNTGPQRLDELTQSLSICNGCSWRQ